MGFARDAEGGSALPLNPFKTVRIPWQEVGGIELERGAYHTHTTVRRRDGAGVRVFALGGQRDRVALAAAVITDLLKGSMGDKRVLASGANLRAAGRGDWEALFEMLEETPREKHLTPDPPIGSRGEVKFGCAAARWWCGVAGIGDWGRRRPLALPRKRFAVLQ